MKPRFNDLPASHRIAIVILVDGASFAALNKTLGCFPVQTLQKHLFSIFLVGHATEKTDFNQAFLDTRDDKYADINIVQISLNSAHLPIDAKIVAAEQANSPLIMFLSAGDTIDADFLKKAALALEAAPKGAWVYSNLIKSVPYKVHVNAPPFSPHRVLFSRDLVYDGVYRVRDWLKAAKKARKKGGHPLYNDTLAIFLHMMRRAGFGIPMRDTNLYSDRSVFLSSKRFLLSKYITFRLNILCFFFLFKSRAADQAHIKKGHGYRSKIHPMYWLDRWQQKMNAKYLGNAGLKAVISFKMVLLSMFLPNSFVKKFLNPETAISLADMICGFVVKPQKVSESIPPNDAQAPVILVAQTNWMIGGAEKILLDWVENAREIGDCKIIDLCERDRFGEFNSAVKDQFSQLVDEQYNLDRIAATPLQRKKICWNLISAERPGIIFISGNAFVYSLLPDIKKYLPNVFVADILHNEWDIPGDWFDVSYEYKNYIDSRITTSEYWASRMITCYEERKSKVKVFLNSIRTDRFDSELFPKSENRIQLSVPEDKFVVGFIGRLHRQKNPGVFYELARLMSRYSSYHFIVVGDGDERENLLSRYSNLKNLTYFGAANDVRPFIAVCDVVVYCSTYEGFPMMSLESAAMNTPIIAPNIVGFRDQIDMGHFGLLYQPTDNAAEDAETIYAILTRRKEELTALGMNGRRYIDRFHSHEVLSVERTGFFENALSRIQSLPLESRAVRKKKRIYLHIGMHKTGTTSIQHFAYMNRSSLSQKGLLYTTKSIHGRAHHVLAQRFSMNKNIFDINEKQRIQTPFQLEGYKQHLLNAEQDKILLSSEGFLFADVGELSAYLSDFDVTVIIFVRRQDHWLESTYNQNLKMGSFIDQAGDHILTPQQHYQKTKGQLDYLKHVDRFAASFGKENLVVVPFEKDAFPEGLEKYFCQLLGITYDSSWVTTGIHNPSLDQVCLGYLATKRPDDRMDRQQYHKLIKLLEQYSLTGNHQAIPNRVYSPAFRRKLIETFADSNRRLALDFVQNGDGVLFKEPLPDTGEPWAAFKPIDAERIDQIDTYLISRGVSPEQLVAGGEQR